MAAPTRRLPAADLDHILEHTQPLWEKLRGGHLFLTGGTGFYGCWLLESLLHANLQLDLDARVTVLTRDPAAFAARAPHLAEDAALRLMAGDVRDFAFPAERFSHVIHAATDARPKLHSDAPAETLEIIVEGTRRVLDLARQCGASVLLASSGAIYGPQPAELTHVGEEYRGAPDPLDARAAYAQGKRFAESLGASYGRQYGLPVMVARGFAFVGPLLPLDEHFAIGNFMRDVLAEQPIKLSGDGTPVRSYLYAADLTIWLWTILLKGTPGRAYNVGSSDAYPLTEVARKVAVHAAAPQAVVVAREADPKHAPACYVPSVERAETELGLKVSILLDEAIARTLAWHRA